MSHVDTGSPAADPADLRTGVDLAVTLSTTGAHAEFIDDPSSVAGPPEHPAR